MLRIRLWLAVRVNYKKEAALYKNCLFLFPVFNIFHCQKPVNTADFSCSGIYWELLLFTLYAAHADSKNPGSGIH